MDSTDDFEFKPITEGLGFHNKNKSLSQSVESSGFVSKQMTQRIPNEPLDDLSPVRPRRTYEDLLKSLETEPVPEVGPAPGPQIIEPLGRKAPVQPESPTDSGVGEAAPLFPPKLKLQMETGTRRGGADSPVSPFEESAFCLPAMALDAVVVVALSLLFVVSLLIATKLNFVSVLLSARADIFAQLSFVVLFISVIEMYVIVSRSFFGRTLGEWTFDHQLGETEEHQQAFFPLRVMYRSFIVLITGFVILPVLSLIQGKDIAGRMTGLKLLKLKGT